jgi:hypothetical protein
MPALRILLVAIIAGGLYIGFTGHGLPPTLASHFGAGGQPNGSMSKTVYLELMLGLMALVPLLIFGTTQLIRLAPMSLVRMPNKEQWLGPGRREETLAFLSRQTAIFGCGMVVFLCFVHHLVVNANRVQPPQLPVQTLVLGLMVFMAFSFAWAGFFVARFLRRS